MTRLIQFFSLSQHSTSGVFLSFVRTSLILAALAPIVSPPALAQSTFQGLGHFQPGIKQSEAHAVSDDGRVVTGWALDTAFGKRAFRWTTDGGLEMLPIPTGFTESDAFGLSDDGTKAVGTLYDSVGFTEVYYWDSASGPAASGVLTAGNTTEGSAITGDGAVILGWSWAPHDSGQVFSWAPPGGTLSGYQERMSGRRFYAYAVSDAESVFVGKEDTPSGGYLPAIWENSSVSNLTLQGSLVRGIALDVTPDGKTVVGMCRDSIGGTRPDVAVRWTSRSTPGDLGSLDPVFSDSWAWAVSADGEIVVGESFGRAFIWTEKTGMRDLRQVLIGMGLDLTGWTLSSAQDISDDGTTVVGKGSNPDGDFEAWRATLTSITVVDPIPGALWIAGEQDTIRWESNGVDTVILHYSTDYDTSSRTGTFELVDFDIPADSGRYVWEIPEDILSKKCVIRIAWQQDSVVVADTSGLFRIKGYVLTRDSADQWEPFRFEADRWNFGNAEPNMWPDGWWSQFDYQAGADPYTVNFYPQDPTYPFHRTESDSFPDWPLFVQTFGEDQCYQLGSPLLGFYKPSATTRWDAISDEWGGSCSGFSISSLLAFTDSSNFRTIYTTMPAYTDLVSIDTSSAVRLVINELANHWWGRQHSAYVSAVWGDSPKETLAKLKSLLLLDDPPIGYLYIKNNNGSGAHAVVPYQVRNTVSDNIFSIDVYDNSYPTDDAAQIEVDTSAGAGRGTWDYPNWPGWGGDSSMLVMDPAGSYLLRPVWPSPSIPSRPVPAASAGEVRIVPALNSAVEIGDGIGHRMGYRDSIAYNDIPGARPDIPPTGRETPPYSYLLPEGTYSMTMDRFGGPASEIFVFSEAAFVHYRRTDADSSQTDRFSYDGGFSAVNPDPAPRAVNVSMLLVGDTTNEKQFTLSGYEMAQNDSIHLSAVNGDHLRFVNAGGGSGYGLHLLTVSNSGVDKFFADGLTMDAGSAHVVSPDWNDLHVVPIYIDNGNDGSIDDSMFVGNLVDVKERGIAGVPESFDLGQNYPNPFNPATRVPFAVAETGPVSIAIYDVLGREVAQLIDRTMVPGSYEVTWDASSRPAGVYFARMVAGGFTAMISLVYVK